jgi:KipI family sensor histidine kinase inhibitor
MSENLHVYPLGDSAVSVVFGTQRTPELLARIHSAARSLAAAGFPHVHDIVPAYLALTVFYDPLHVSYEEVAREVLEHCEKLTPARENDGKTADHRIAVRYDGLDIDWVCSSTGLSVEEVIVRHSAKTYTVDLLGFVPGFAYLSELDPSLQLPRRPQPRPRVAAGSVAIAAAQTAVYPLDTPGGWHIIGSTDTVLFDPTRDPPALLAPGDRVRFERVQ